VGTVLGVIIGLIIGIMTIVIEKAIIAGIIYGLYYLIDIPSVGGPQFTFWQFFGLTFLLGIIGRLMFKSKMRDDNE